MERFTVGKSSKDYQKDGSRKEFNVQKVIDAVERAHTVR